MFKVGDKIVCIDTSEDVYHELKYEKIYTVNYVFTEVSNAIKIDGIKRVWYTERFISIRKYRKLKLQKICSK